MLWQGLGEGYALAGPRARNIPVETKPPAIQVYKDPGNPWMPSVRLCQ